MKKMTNSRFQMTIRRNEALLFLTFLVIGATMARNDAATNGPIKIYSRNATIFADKNDNPVWLTGLSVCCAEAKANGWPWISTGMIDKVVNHSCNWVHMRMGPFVQESEGAGWDAYKIVSGKYDLSQFDEAYFNRARDRVLYARSKGVYVEVDVIDGWVLRHGLSPWNKSRNTRNEELGACSGTPNDVQTRFARKVVQTLGDLDNVIYQIGNETFQCATTWEKGVNDAIRDEMRIKSFPTKLIGVNAHKSSTEGSSWADIINIHDEGTGYPQLRNGKPTGNNEYVVGITPDLFTEFIWRAFTDGCFYQYWRGSNSESDLEKAFDRMKIFKDFLNTVHFGSFKKMGNNVTGIAGKEYVAYLKSSSVALNLSGTGSFKVFWLNPRTGVKTQGTVVKAGSVTFQAPGTHHVLHVTAQETTRNVNHGIGPGTNAAPAITSSGSGVYHVSGGAKSLNGVEVFDTAGKRVSGYSAKDNGKIGVTVRLGRPGTYIFGISTADGLTHHMVYVQ